MKHALLRWVAGAVMLLSLAAPATVLARTEEVQREPIDARLEGYSDPANKNGQTPLNVTLETGSTGLTWFITVILGVIVFGGLFKDAKRSHLD